MGRVIEDYFSRQSWSVPVKVERGFARRLLEVLYPFKAFLVAVLLFIARAIARRSPSDLPCEDPILVDTFILKDRGAGSGSIQGGNYQDRYYPGLKEALGSEKERLLFVPQLVGFGLDNYRKLFCEIRDADTAFLIKDDYLRLKDYFYALGFPLRVLRESVPATRFEGFELRTLIRGHLWRNAASYSSMQGILNYRFVQRLNDAGVSLRRFLIWYENQPIDRGMVRGLKRYYPETLTVGYVGFFPRRHTQIHIPPTADEVDADLIPDRLAVIGPGLIPTMKEFYSKVEVSVGPAFRFKWVFAERPPNWYSVGQEAFNVLVALPIYRQAALDLLQAVVEVSNTVGDDVHFTVKPHPSLRRSELDPTGMLSSSSMIELTEESIDRCLNEAEMTVACGTSVCVESLAQGVPVAVTDLGAGFVRNPIPPDLDQRIWSICLSSEDLIGEIRDRMEVRREARSLYQEIARKIRNRYFEAISRSSVRGMLGIESRPDRRSVTR